MEYTVPVLSIIFMVIAALAGLAIPVALLLFFRKKFKANVAPFFVGCAVFIVFALLIEGTINMLIFKSAPGAVIGGNVWLLGAFGGLMAGLFEETGRFTAFKIVLKKKRGNDGNALMYGAGHGGFEVFFVLSVGMASNLFTAVMLNAGMAGTLTAGVKDPAALQQLNALFAALSGTAPTLFLVSIVERVAAVALHLSLSVLVWFAVKDRKRFWLYPLAILIHALIDACAVVLARSGVNIWIIEGVVYILAAASVAIAVAVWKKNRAAAEVSDIEITPAE